MTSLYWQTYHDPFGLYTMQLPPGWAAQTEPASTDYYTSNGTIKVSVEIITFSNLSQGTGSAHIYITARQINTSYEHQYFCQPPVSIQGFSPLSLNTMEHTGGVALFETANGAFQIDAAIPGVIEPVTTVPQYLTPQPTTTPLPASWIATDQTEVNRMLTSFQPTDPMPLVC